MSLYIHICLLRHTKCLIFRDSIERGVTEWIQGPGSLFGVIGSCLLTIGGGGAGRGGCRNNCWIAFTFNGVRLGLFSFLFQLNQAKN